MLKNNEKVFLIFNTTCIGDILINNALCQNIKHFYPDSKIVFIVNPLYRDVALYQKGVDDVVFFDRKKDNNLKSILKFLWNFPYKKPFASFVIYSNDRNLIFSKILGAKHIVSHSKNILRFLHSKENYKMQDYETMKNISASLIEPLIGKSAIDYPIVYDPQNIDTPIIRRIKSLVSENEVIGLCPFSNYVLKDMPLELSKELIEKLNSQNKKVVLLGAGQVAREYSKNLKKAGCIDFIDLVDCTSFRELAVILKTIKGLISVDTGTMHFANAVGCPVVAVFYIYTTERDVVKMWAPDEKLYRAITIKENQTADNILSKLDILLKEGDISNV